MIHRRQVGYALDEKEPELKSSPVKLRYFLLVDIKAQVLVEVVNVCVFFVTSIDLILLWRGPTGFVTHPCLFISTEHL